MVARVPWSLHRRAVFCMLAVMQPVTRRQLPTVSQGADPDRKLRLGLIGCGWYGMEDAKAALKVGGGGKITRETGTKVSWDPQTETIPHNVSASNLLQRDYRKPWKHPYVA
jgi:hypothetical protein